MRNLWSLRAPKFLNNPNWPFDDKFIRKPLKLNPTTLTNIVETKNYKTSGEYIKSRIIQASVFA